MPDAVRITLSLSRGSEPPSGMTTGESGETGSFIFQTVVMLNLAESVSADFTTSAPLNTGGDDDAAPESASGEGM